MLLPALLLLAALLPGSLAAAAAAPEPQGANAASVVQQFDPAASTITSVSPAQSSALAEHIPAYISGYTASHPLSSLQAQIAVDVALGSAPPASALGDIAGLLGAAPTALPANPGPFLSSVNALVSGYDFATDVYAYESGLVDGLRTVVNSDLSVTPATTAAASASTSSSKGAAAALPQETGAVRVAALGAAAAVVGIMAL